MKPTDVPMPPQIAALEQDERGYPKFYVIQPPEGHELHFRVLNYEKILECGKRELCGVCGLTLPYRKWFLGSPEDASDRVYAFPPMHRDCLDYALAVCPFLSGHYRPTHRLPDGFVKSEIVDTAKGDLVLYCTRSYKVQLCHGQPIFKVAPATAIEWRDENGKSVDAEV